MKCPNCSNELEEEFYMREIYDDYEEEIWHYTCKKCGNVYEGSEAEYLPENLKFYCNKNDFDNKYSAKSTSDIPTYKINVSDLSDENALEIHKDALESFGNYEYVPTAFDAMAENPFLNLDKNPFKFDENIFLNLDENMSELDEEG